MPSMLERIWYGRSIWHWLLIPFSFVYRVIVHFRRFFLQRFGQQPITVPVIVIGNLSLGGVGKTPLVIALAEKLRQRGLRVGIVSRGYGAAVRSFPHEVTVKSEARLVGDEPLLIARRTGCPVVIAPKRVEAVSYLLDNYDSQVIISDDGLQHYAMARSIEVVVIDGLRGVGNGWCLPAGPLREPVSRLKQADFVVANGGQWPAAYSMNLKPGKMTHLQSGQQVDSNQWLTPVAAIAAIGHPQRFFTTLLEQGIDFVPYPFPDHHVFTRKELQFSQKTVVMTEKDAVKCQSFAADNWYYLPVEAMLSDSFWQALWSHEQLKGLIFK